VVPRSARFLTGGAPHNSYKLRPCPKKVNASRAPGPRFQRNSGPGERNGSCIFVRNSIWRSICRFAFDRLTHNPSVSVCSFRWGPSLNTSCMLFPTHLFCKSPSNGDARSLKGNILVFYASFFRITPKHKTFGKNHLPGQKKTLPMCCIVYSLLQGPCIESSIQSFPIKSLEIAQVFPFLNPSRSSCRKRGRDLLGGM